VDLDEFEEIVDPLSSEAQLRAGRAGQACGWRSFGEDRARPRAGKAI